jgi:hypothetical protein
MTLHIYGQEAWHDCVHIVGTWEALCSLHATLGALVADQATDSAATFFVNDGEGYTVQVRVETEAAMAQYCVPYTASYAADQDRHAQNLHWPKKDR